MDDIRTLEIETEEIADFEKDSIETFFNSIKSLVSRTVDKMNQDSVVKYAIPTIFYWSHVQSEKGKIFTNGFEYVPATWSELAKLLSRFYVADVDNGINAALDWTQELTKKIFNTASDDAELERIAEAYSVEFIESDVIK